MSNRGELFDLIVYDAETDAKDQTPKWDGDGFTMKYTLRLPFAFLIAAGIGGLIAVVMIIGRSDAYIVPLCLAVPCFLFGIHFLTWRCRVTREKLTVIRFEVLRKTIFLADIGSFMIKRDPTARTPSFVTRYLIIFHKNGRKMHEFWSVVTGFEKLKKHLAARGVKRTWDRGIGGRS